jgi:hypothetical protein
LKAQVSELLHQAPRHLGLPRSRWWLDGLRQAVTALGAYTLPGIWTVLERLHLRYKRGRTYLHSPDPDYGLKRQYIAAAYRQAQAEPQRIVLLYQDELTYYRRPSVARSYAPAGSARPLAPLGYRGNSKRRISGSLNAVSGQLHVCQRQHLGVTQLRRYYQQLEAAYPLAQRIYLVQDNWPVHRHPELLLYFLTSRITPLWLPTYAPWTNPTEKVWLWLKHEVLHLHDFADDWHGLQLAVSDWLAQWELPSPRLLRYVALTPY